MSASVPRKTSRKSQPVPPNFRPSPVGATPKKRPEAVTVASPSVAPVTESTSTTSLWAAGLIALAALLAYSNSFSGAFIYDDDQAIIQNPSILHLWPPWIPLLPPPHLTVGGRPILNLTFAINYAISGMSVWSYHVVNLLIHILAGVTLFGVMRRTLLQPVLRSRFGAEAAPLAAAVALLWTLNPLQTESVSYISQRAESLMGLFYLLTIYSLIRASEQEANRLRWSILCVASCALGIITKEVAVTAPLLALAYDRTFITGTFRESLRARWRLYVALAATWLLMGYTYIGVEKRAIGYEYGVTGWSYALTECPAILHYVVLMIWPHPLLIDYGMTMVTNPMEVIPEGLFVLALLAATVVAFIYWPMIGFVGVCFFVILGPTSSFFPIVVSPVGEHRLYLPVAAVLALFVLGLHRLMGHPSRYVFLGVAIIYGALTYERNIDYRSAVNLWGVTVDQMPSNARAHNNYGVSLLDAGRAQDAVAQFEEAARLNSLYADAFYNCGNALLQLGQFPEAIAHFDQALRIKPQFPGARNNWANTLVQMGRYPEAIAQYELAAQLDPGNPGVQYNWGHLLLEMKKYPEAKLHFEKALQIDPGMADARNTLGIVLFETGHKAEALEQFHEALRLNPGMKPAMDNLARIQAMPDNPPGK